METIRIRRMGYAVRLPFEEFILRYGRWLAKSLFRYRPIKFKYTVELEFDAETCKEMLESIAVPGDYLLGETKVFLAVFPHCVDLLEVQSCTETPSQNDGD